MKHLHAKWSLGAVKIGPRLGWQWEPGLAWRATLFSGGPAVGRALSKIGGWSADAALTAAKEFGMKMPDQQAFITQFGAALSAGKIEGYPKA